MGFLKEFKEFAMKGNVMDMAVGVIIGGAFGKIVSSLVDDIIMPFVSANDGIALQLQPCQRHSPNADSFQYLPN